MKMKITIIILLILSTIRGILAQESFTYTIIENNPDIGNMLFAGIGSASMPFFGRHFERGAIGPEIQAYNIFSNFSLKFNSYFQTGLYAFALMDDETRTAKDIKFYSSDLIVTAPIHSYFKSKEREILLRQTGGVNYVSNIEHKEKNVIGLRIGYGMMNAPLYESKPIYGAIMPDSSNIYLYGFNIHSLSVGLSLSRLTNFTIDTDLFGEIKKKGVRNLYLDFFFNFKTKGYFNKTPTQSMDDFLDKGISFRLGSEKIFQNKKSTLATKIGYEIVKRKHYDLDNSFFDMKLPFYVQFKFAIMGIVKK